MSNILSASSNTKKLTLSRRVAFFLTRSMSRPGVATMISAPSSHALHCSHRLPPPYAHTTFMLYTLPNFLASW